MKILLTQNYKSNFVFLVWIHIYNIIASKRDRIDRYMLPTMENYKQKRVVDNFSTKYHFNPPYIDRYMVNGVYSMIFEVIGGCVDETIV